MEPIGNIMHVCKTCNKLKKEFWQEKYKGIPLLGTKVKIEFKQRGIPSEYMWVQVSGIDPNSGAMMGRLKNDPYRLTNVKYGDTVYFNRNQICQHIDKNLDATSGFLEAKEYINSKHKHRQQKVQLTDLIH